MLFPTKARREILGLFFIPNNEMLNIKFYEINNSISRLYNSDKLINSML